MVEMAVTTPRREEAACDPSVMRVLHKWQHLVAVRQHSHLARREEKRRELAAKRDERATREALLAFATAGSHRQRVLLVRHGEALHNAQWRRHSSTLDTPLTERGCEQAQRLAGSPALTQATLLVVSPLTRAVQTAVHIFGAHPTCRTCICPLHSERVDDERAACNHGSPKTTLLARFPFLCTWEGLDDLPEQWWPTAKSDAGDRWRTERVPAFLTWLGSQPESKVVVVGHGAFFSDTRLAGRMMSNCEIVVMNDP